MTNSWPPFTQLGTAPTTLAVAVTVTGDWQLDALGQGHPVTCLPGQKGPNRIIKRRETVKWVRQPAVFPAAADPPQAVLHALPCQFRILDFAAL